MRFQRSPTRAILLAFGALCSTAMPSDHADPMNVINPFQLQEDPVANITDLHAFVVDTNGRPVLDVKDSDQLIVSLCVRRRLLPGQISSISNDVPKYSFRVHLDLDPEVRFHDANRTRDGRNFQQVLAALDDDVNKALAARNAARQQFPPKDGKPSEEETKAQMELLKQLSRRGGLVSQHQRDRSMQALYGGVLDQPDRIAAEATLDFHLKFASDDVNSEVELDATRTRIEGVPGRINMVAEQRAARDGGTLVQRAPFTNGAINIQCGIFDDPFIFPRFFRGNVVGIVTSIPLDRLRRPDGQSVRNGPILLWATTHRPDGRQSDHVGRSLRTQLPRFGYLNPLHPSKHVAEITRVHDKPNLLENVLTTFIAPLEAHRHYDSAPDVMVYDLRKPAKFPNGRWLEDDVAATLAEAGETLLVELAYAESRQFPRATVNDKPFRPNFPYLATRWTGAETAEHAMPGTTFGQYQVPDAPDADAIALPDLGLGIWKSIRWGLFLGIVGLGVLAWLAARGVVLRAATLFLVIVGLCLIHSIQAPRLPNTNPAFMRQPQGRFLDTIYGTGIIALLVLLGGYGYGVRRGYRRGVQDSVPLGDQAESAEDRQYSGSTYEEVRDAVLAQPYYGSVWNGQPLPNYPSGFATLVRGLFSATQRHMFMDAAARTLASHADLRWGPDRKGSPRMLHPNGVCLAGTWSITGKSDYTGYFAKGSTGRIIARYSTGVGVRRGQKRTLALVGKLYPDQPQNADKPKKQRPASFITQEDLAAADSPSIFDAALFNAPNITIWKRGFDIHSFLLIAFTFFRVDSRNSIRQLYEVAELGKSAGSKTNCPQFMRLTISSPHVTDKNDPATADFRDEVLAQIYDRGQAKPARKLVFDIEVANDGSVRGLFNKKLKVEHWEKIGKIEFTEAAASYNGDCVIHFHHPQWRDRLNDDKAGNPGPSIPAQRLNALVRWLLNIASYFAKLKAKAK